VEPLVVEDLVAAVAAVEADLEALAVEVLAAAEPEALGNINYFSCLT
jgi:outer membrane murein-binding lipoprotein Lpp